MKKYLRIYKTLALLNWYALLEYRSDFVTRIFASLTYASYHVITVLILTQNVPVVFGWTRNELLLLAATYSVFIGLYHMFISKNLARLADEIYYGRLDFMLLKPMDSQFSATLWMIDYVNVIRVIFGLAISGYLLTVMGISLSIVSLLLYIFILIVGIYILYSIWLSFVSITIFYPRLSNIVTLLFQASTIARFPREMYAKIPVIAFTLLLPLMLIMVNPARVLTQSFSWSHLIEMLTVCFILGITSRMIWRYSLKYYASASS